MRVKIHVVDAETEAEDSGLLDPTADTPLVNTPLDPNPVKSGGKDSTSTADDTALMIRQLYGSYTAVIRH
jgi:hypothetical protein